MSAVVLEKGIKTSIGNSQQEPWKLLDEYFKACCCSQLVPTQPGFTFLAVAAVGSLVKGQKDLSFHPSELQALTPFT